MQKLPILMAIAMMSFGTHQMQADEVKVTTQLSTGSSLTLALNADLTAKILWSGVESQTITSDGSLITLTVQSPTLTISSQTGNITSLYLQGNKISSIDLSDATNLSTLLAADNLLTEIDLSNCKQLVTLDLQGNQLTSLNASSLPLLEEINLADNQISGTSLKLNSSARPTSYVVANNQLTSPPSSLMLKQVRTMWVQGNQLKTLNLSQATELHSLVASSNQITTLTLANMPRLNEVWVDNNQLTTLDLSKGSPKLSLLAADHNKLTTITWDTDCKSNCRNVYVSNNALFINSMPSAKYGGKEVNVVYDPQDDYQMSVLYDLNTTYDWSALLAKNGWGITTGVTYTLTDDNNYTLVKGTDFTETGKKFTFTTAHSGVILSATNTNYAFRTVAFNIGTEGDAIENITDDSQALISTQKGQISVATQSRLKLRIYTTAGTLITNTTAEKGTNTFALPAGIYIVNGKKIMVP